ncbi:MAG TPA: NUDIX domain-containing protein [Thermoplasmata archaeon]|nr:NUDIX domain-containing protein [Thermoplasmata archaeon]
MRRAPTAAPPLPTAVTSALLRWYRSHRRPLPWRRDRDPYRVWVAEVLLQQTRVAQAVPYFERFVREFPTVEALARSSPERVLKVWEGAGYYARAHHLLAAARLLLAEHDGKLPSTEEGLERLPGVGPYIARAVAAIAFNRPCVALEANGLRVAARWTRETGDVRTPVVRARLERVLGTVLPSENAGAFTEAVMELGETVCGPVRPDCPSCPVAFACRAYRELDDPSVIPARRRRAPRPHVRAAVVVLMEGGKVLVQRRPSNGLLPGLWEFPGGRIEPHETPEAAARRELREETGAETGLLTRLGIVRHAYSHFAVDLHAFAGHPRGAARPAVGPDRRWVTWEELGRLPIPKATEKVVRLVTPVPDRAFRGSGSRRGRTRASRPGGSRPRRRRAPR